MAESNYTSEEQEALQKLFADPEAFKALLSAQLADAVTYANSADFEAMFPPEVVAEVQALAQADTAKLGGA